MSRAFRMPPVESLADHLLQLADPWAPPVEGMVGFLEFRFPEDRSTPRLRSWLRRMSRGTNGPIGILTSEVSTLVRDYLASFVEGMPATFDLRGVGMLEILLAGGYLRHRGQLDSVIYLFLFARLLGIRGRVRPAVMDDVGIVAELADGSLISVSPGDSRWEEEAAGEEIRRIDAAGWTGATRIDVAVDPQAEELIRSAEILCSPPDRFFSGLLATLFPSGIGKAVAESGVPKVWVPDVDPGREGTGLSLPDRLLLLAHAQRGERELKRGALLDCILVDPRAPGVEKTELRRMEEMGFHVVRLPLSAAGGDGLDGSRLAEAVLSLG